MNAPALTCRDAHVCERCDLWRTCPLAVDDFEDLADQSRLLSRRDDAWVLWKFAALFFAVVAAIGWGCWALMLMR